METKKGSYGGAEVFLQFKTDGYWVKISQHV